ncbi:MAG: aminoacyl-tRNA hydrolase [Gammaproteobacteria bacterium]|nr:aminoacyl-tRNA hydrolase [Gammaproteobacteria bacterium]
MRSPGDDARRGGSIDEETSSLQLIVGLGNPGSKYADTRHNVGERWVRDLADQFAISLRNESRFKGLVGRGEILDREVRILVPATFMNLSGQSVGPLARYFRIPVNRILVAYDEVAFPAGTCKLKVGGGHNGHNGVKSLINALGGNRDFARLRIGVGHPGSPDQMHTYLTGCKMPSGERIQAESASKMGDDLLESVVSGNWQKAMLLLHSHNE